MALAVAKKLNFRIGTKLASMSILGILMVIGLLYAIIHGDGIVREENARADLQQTICGAT